MRAARNLPATHPLSQALAGWLCDWPGGHSGLWFLEVATGWIAPPHQDVPFFPSLQLQEQVGAGACGLLLGKPSALGGVHPRSGFGRRGSGCAPGGPALSRLFPSPCQGGGESQGLPVKSECEPRADP